MERYLDNSGTTLWSISSGDGVPLIMCNGGPGCDDYLGPVSAMIEDLCTVIRFEQRGCGRSDYDKQYDLDTTIGDMEFVRNAYGFDRIIVGGHSAGVGFALAYALTYPESVMGIVGLSGGCVVDDREWSRIYHENLSTYGEDNGGREFQSDPEVNKMGSLSWRAFIKTPTLLRDLAQIDVPAVFIKAGNDIRPNWPTQQLAHLLKKGQYVEIDGAGHYIWVTHPAELRTELTKAIETITA